MFHQTDPGGGRYLEGFESFPILLKLLKHQDLDDNGYEQKRTGVETLYTDASAVLTTKIGSTVVQTSTTTAPVVVRSPC